MASGGAASRPPEADDQSASQSTIGLPVTALAMAMADPLISHSKDGSCRAWVLANSR